MKFINRTKSIFKNIKKKPSRATQIIKFFSDNPDELTNISTDELKNIKKILEVSQDYHKNLGMLGIGISVVFSSFTLYVNNLFTSAEYSKQAAVAVVLILAGYFFNQISRAITKLSKLSAIIKTIDLILERRSEIKSVRISRLEKKYLKR